MATNAKIYAHAVREHSEKMIEVGRLHGGHDGFIPKYMAENKKRGNELATRLTEIQATESGRLALLRMTNRSTKEEPYKPLTLFMQELTDEDKKNPAVLRIVLNEMGTIFEKLLPTLSDSDANQNEKNFLTVAKEDIELRLRNKGMHAGVKNVFY